MTTDPIASAISAERARAAAAVREIVERELQAGAEASRRGDDYNRALHLERYNIARECLAAVEGER